MRREFHFRCCEGEARDAVEIAFPYTDAARSVLAQIDERASIR